jgi:hypothetical protein
MTSAQIKKLLKPESELESKLLLLPELQSGLLWGEPRFGHPEGKVVYHVEEIFSNIDQLNNLPAALRAQLRIIAIVHDAFKHLEVKSHPRNWDLHHGTLARKATEHLLDDAQIQDIIELHDEAYYCWRGYRQLAHDDIQPRYTLDSLVTRIEPFLMEYMLFFRIDTLTGDKNPAPLIWFEDAVTELKRRTTT